MANEVSWPQALAWRLKRQLLDPVGAMPVANVVRRLGGVQTQVASSAELAVRLRRIKSRKDEVSAALNRGRLIKTWAMRGTLHLLTPEEGGAFLSLMASGRSWERPSWQKYFGVSPADVEALRGVVRQALDGKVLTREELIAAVTQNRRLAHVGEILASGWGTLLKPLAWQGDLCFGPQRGNRVTFTLPESASDRWSGLPDPDEAAPVAIATYLGAYGPATADVFGTWLAGGWFGRRRLGNWFEGLGDRLTEVDVDGERAFIMTEHLDDLLSTSPTAAVRLLPGFDQYVLGPGTKDPHVIPGGRRPDVSRQSGWIAPVVVSKGVVCGTWELDRDQVRISWFEETGRVPRRAIGEEVGRLASILDRDLTWEVA